LRASGRVFLPCVLARPSRPPFLPLPTFHDADTAPGCLHSRFVAGRMAVFFHLAYRGPYTSGMPLTVHLSAVRRGLVANGRVSAPCSPLRLAISGRFSSCFDARGVKWIRADRVYCSPASSLTGSFPGTICPTRACILALNLGHYCAVGRTGDISFWLCRHR
jgi:hypothetical protein